MGHSRPLNHCPKWEIRLVCPIWGNFFIEAKSDPFSKEIGLWCLGAFVLWFQMSFYVFIDDIAILIRTHSNPLEPIRLRLFSLSISQRYHTLPR